MVEDWCYHYRNIQAKIVTDYGGKSNKFKEFLEKGYLPFHKAQMAIKGTSKQDIKKKVRLLEAYYKKVQKIEIRLKVKSQSKLRSTILEEFCGYLFKDLSGIKKLGLNFYNKKVFAGITLNAEGQTYPKTKDVDFCIGKEVNADFNGNKQAFIIPVIAIECKTYTDKTMFSEAQFTAQTLKHGSPNVRVYILAETNQIALDELPFQTPIDQYFAIRGGKGDEEKPIDYEVVFDFLGEVKEAIENATKEKIRKLPGKLIIS